MGGCVCGVWCVCVWCVCMSVRACVRVFEERVRVRECARVRVCVRV